MSCECDTMQFLYGIENIGGERSKCWLPMLFKRIVQTLDCLVMQETKRYKESKNKAFSPYEKISLNQDFVENM